MRGRGENPIHTAAKRDAPCSTCGASPGESCTNRKGGNAWPPHKARLDWAARWAVEQRRPEPERTATECLALLGEVYTPEGLAILLRATHPALGEPTVAEHLETPAGCRKVYGLALALSEGAFS